jgi:hypothetical protein
MKYYLDCEFDSWNGPLLSLGLVREDRESLYLVYVRNCAAIKEQWVKTNVEPILWSVPSPMPGMAYKIMDNNSGAHAIGGFLHGDDSPTIVADWPDDIAYFCKALITGPGMMIKTPDLKFEVRHVEAYPTDLPGAIQHNAYWDAKALWYYHHKHTL